MMEKSKKRIWVLLPVVALIVLGSFWFFQWRQEQKKHPALEVTAPPENQEGKAEEELSGGLSFDEEASVGTIPEEDSGAAIEEKMIEFFRYLDTREYIQKIYPEMETYTRFKEILKRLSEKPPIPAGEGADPDIIIRNIFHFYHTLNRKDLRLIKEIITHEQDSLETEIENVYQWLMLNDSRSDPEGLRPSMEVLYEYAGFFINTTGGRAYLFRRTTALRLLVSYYSILIIHEADKAGKNIFGIDISPHIPLLRGEIIRYPDFKFQQRYIDRLSLIENYYLQKRLQR